jgi:hypothetical protein
MSCGKERETGLGEGDPPGVSIEEGHPKVLF